MERPMDFRLPVLNGILMTAALVIAVLLGCAPAAAQGGAFTRSNTRHIDVSLVAETPQPKAGNVVTLAIIMKPQPGWHGYWENPGDAGAGLTATWNVPAGSRPGPLRYPIPQRLIISGLMNHVYEHDYAILVDLSLPANLPVGARLPVRLAAQWLACTDSICVPEQGEVSTELTIGGGRVTPENQARFDSYRAALPRPLDQQASYALSGRHIRISVPYPAGAPVADPWFYALSKNRLRYAEPQVVRRVGDRLVVETSLVDGAEEGGALEGVLAVSPGVALRLRAIPGVVPEGGTIVGRPPTAKVGAISVLLALAGAFLGGLILNVMPCVFPILSLKAISLAKAGGNEVQVRSEAVAYTAGILLTCLALGAAMLAIRAGGAQIGWAFQLQDARVIAVLLLLMVAITLNLAGLFEIAAIGAGQDKAMQGGNAGAFWTGALAAFVATPCTGPFMGAAMGAALVLPWPLALTVFAGLGLGLASPFVAIAYVAVLRRLMPQPGGWMNIFRRIMAVPMGLTALGLLWLLSRQAGTPGLWLGLALAMGISFALFAIGARQRSGKGGASVPALAAMLALAVVALVAPPMLGAGKATSHSGLLGEPFSEAKLAALRSARQPVFLYFTADWCLTCKVNEANAIDTEEVRDAFRKGKVQVLVGDWTNADPAISRFLESQGRSGVPLYLYYAPGAKEPQTLPQVLTISMLSSLVRG